MYNKNENKTLLSKNFNSFLLRKNFEVPFNDLIDNLFNQFFNKFIPSRQESFASYYGNYPKCDIKDYSDKYQIQMEIPGMKKEDIKIQYDKDNQTLSISGIKRTQKDLTDVNFIRRQLKKSEFVRSFYISKDQIEEDFNATFENGVLTIDIKKKINSTSEKEKTKEIPIN